MKPWLIFIVVFLSSLQTARACGPYYPEGEGKRFGLLSTDGFDLDGFRSFNYCASRWYYGHWRSVRSEDISTALGRKMNVELWQQWADDNATTKDIEEAVYHIKSISDHGVKNAFIQWLIKEEKREAIAYLNYAKKAQFFNVFEVKDPWERGRGVSNERSNLIDEAINKIDKVADAQIKKRYAFIAIRLAYYNNDAARVEKLYEQNFNVDLVVDVVDAWALYFRAITEVDPVYRNYLIAKDFATAPDKKRELARKYDRTIPTDKVLQLAKTDADKAAVYLIVGARNVARGQKEMELIYQLSPESKGLDFLVIRELSKLEDWILTPYYTFFSPSISDYSDVETNELMVSRMREDKLYAAKLLEFVKKVDLKLVHNPTLWQLTEAYLFYLNDDFALSLETIEQSTKRYPNSMPEVKHQMELLRAFCLVSLEPKGKAVLSPELKRLVINEEHKGNSAFLFALARKLEFTGNSTDGAIVLSKVNNYQTLKSRMSYWRTPQRHYTLHGDFYKDYFFYLDAQYTPQQVAALIKAIKQNQQSDQPDPVYFKQVESDLMRLYDLLGTKYVRRDALDKALQAFEQVADTFWFSENRPFKHYLDANPFYSNFVNEHKSTKADTIAYTKASIVRTLMTHLEKAKDAKRRDCALHYFLAANCYLNMSYHGNSWMMRRYYWTLNIHLSKLPDDEEYFACKIAEEYYLKAGEVTGAEMFRALCLRMAGRCDNYRMPEPGRYTNLYDWEEQLKTNPHFKQIAAEYPDQYEDLFYICESFDRYFESWNQ